MQETEVATAPQAGLPAAPIRGRSWLILHLLFGVAVAVVLALPWPELGWQVLLLVVGYHAAVVLTARLTDDQVLWRAWTILAPLSLLMVLPDWFLADVLGTLTFPDTGGPFVGSVALAMAGMWTIALMPVVLLALAAEAASAAWNRLAVGAVTALIAGGAVFLLSELLAPALPLWEPGGVATIGGVAAYVLIPELVLSLCTYLLVRTSWMIPHWATALLTVLLPFTYLGMLAVSYQFLG